MSFVAPEACTLPTVDRPVRLTGPAGLETTVRDLADDGEALALDVGVPAQYAGVLASLARQAITVSAGPTS